MAEAKKAPAKKAPAKKVAPAKKAPAKPVAEKAPVEKAAAEKPAPEIKRTGDPVKDRFLEALAKKQGHGPNLGAGPSAAGGVRGSQSDANKPQMFRRKSGG
jgi:hypothetical protein